MGIVHDIWTVRSILEGSNYIISEPMFEEDEENGKQTFGFLVDFGGELMPDTNRADVLRDLLERLALHPGRQYGSKIFVPTGLHEITVESVLNMEVELE